MREPLEDGRSEDGAGAIGGPDEPTWVEGGLRRPVRDHAPSDPPAAPAGSSAEGPTIGPSGAALPAAAGPSASPARRFGRYELREELGRGGMGVVYRAFDTELRREVALKTLLIGEAHDSQRVERLLREARTAGTLDHPGIVPIHDVGVVDGVPYYAMAFVRGRTLHEVLRAGGLPGLRARVGVVCAAAEAVAHAHGRRIVHRDLKPSNLQVDEAGRVHVLDFGLAKRLDEGARLTATGQVMGTPQYMPPEQIQGELARIGPATDVYALGAVLYEVLTGRPPFDGATAAELIGRALMLDPVPPRRLDPAIPADVETICLKCLAKEPRDRYATAGELAADCRRWLAEEPIAARPVGSAVRLWKRAKRNRTVALPVAAAAAVVVGVLAYLVVDQVARTARIAWLRRAVTDALAAGEVERAESDAVDLVRLVPRDAEAERLYRRVKSAGALGRGNARWAEYTALRDELADLGRELERRRRAGTRGQTHADKGPLWELEERQRGVERRGGEAFAAAVSACGEAAGYWKEGETSAEREQARERLGDLYWDRYLEAEAAHRRAEEGTYEALVRTYAEAKYGAALRCERPVAVTFLLPRGFPASPGAPPVPAWLYRYELNHRVPVLVPEPCDPRTGGCLRSMILPPAEPVPLAVAEQAEAAQAAAGAGAAAAPTPATQVVNRARWGSVYRLARLPANRLLLPVTSDAEPGGARPSARDPGRRSEEKPREGGPDALTCRARAVLDLRLPRGSYLLYIAASTPEVAVGMPRAAPGPGLGSAAQPRAAGPRATAGGPPGPGLHEIRYPFQVARDLDWSHEECELPAAAEVPPLPPAADVPPAAVPGAGPGAPPPQPSPDLRAGEAGGAACYWSYVPAGPYRASGDRDATQAPARNAAILRVAGDGRPGVPMPPPADPPRSPAGPPSGASIRAEASVDRSGDRPTSGYYLARFEVTHAMYLRYLNDRTWQAAAEAFKHLPRQAPPATRETVWCAADAQGAYRLVVRGIRPSFPVGAISWYDAADYCKWLTQRRGGGQWRFTLPEEDEWEKAARGPDGRFHTWGDVFDPTFCRMQTSRQDERTQVLPEPYGLFPVDEGPYGIRDLAGGQSEWTSTASGGFLIFKGGSCGSPSAQCRCAYRFVSEPGNVINGYGFRLCARRTP